jgi:hypothetical protein
VYQVGVDSLMYHDAWSTKHHVMILKQGFGMWKICDGAKLLNASFFILLSC